MTNNEQSQNKLYWVKKNLLATTFPDVSQTLHHPNGLLAIGGDLTEERLLVAYEHGIFPWFNVGQPILWWSPDPRCVLEPSEIKISRSLSKRIRKNEYKISYNTAFAEVLEACAAPRNTTDETWITSGMKFAYLHLFKQGYAHSVECWSADKLVGGLYGLAMGKIFFGESMFSRVTDASKIALVYLSQQLEQKKFKLIDCQVESKHLQSMGAKLIQKKCFIQFINQYCNRSKMTDWV